MNMETMILEEWKLGRNFIKAVLEQTLQVKSINEIKEIIKLGFDNIDTNLGIDYIFSYLVFITDFNPDNLQLEQLPGESIYSNGVWIFKANEEESRLLFENVKF